MIALEPAKTPAAKRRDRFYRSRFFVVFRRRNPTFFDGVIFYISTAECATVRRQKILQSDSIFRYFTTALFSVFRRHISCFFNIKCGGVSYHETPPRKSLEIPFRLKINGDTFPYPRINPKNSDKLR